MKKNANFPNLKILDITADDDIATLIRELAGGDRDKLPFGQILNLVLPSGGSSVSCRSVVVEEDYMDRNFSKSYARFYSRTFRDFERRTKRFHFFSADVGFSDFVNEENLQANYLGFCVLSPSEPRTLGRTVLAPPRSSTSQEFVLCQDKFSVNLVGAQLYARGAPFIQQDGRVAACATAALWSATIVASRTFDEISSASTTEITDLARKYTLGASGLTYSPGLNIEQMIWALNELGCAPLKYSLSDHLTARELIYSYVESQMPPVLVLRLPNVEEDGFHALTVVGHTYDKSFSPSEDMPMTYGKGGHYCANEWCPQFVLHDDQMGPYHRLSIIPAAPVVPPREPHPGVILDTTGLTSGQKEEIEEFYKDAELWDIIVPLPSRVFLGADEAAGKGRKLLWRAYTEHRSISWPQKPVFRTYLTSSNSFKRRLVPGRVPGLSDHLSELYRGSLMSRYVWVTELCDLRGRVGVDPADLRVIGEVLIDPTSSALSMDFVAMRIPGLFMYMELDEHDPAPAILRAIPVKNDNPIRPVVR